MLQLDLIRTEDTAEGPRTHLFNLLGQTVSKIEMDDVKAKEASC